MKIVHFVSLLFICLLIQGILTVSTASSALSTSNSLSSYSANVYLVNAYFITPNITLGSPLYLSVNLSNNGQLASGKITVNLMFQNKKSPISYNADPLSPNQQEDMIFIIKNSSQTTGNYTLNLTAHYVSVAASLNTNAVTIGYHIIKSTNPLENNTTMAKQLTQFSITDIPLYTSLSYGTTQISNLNILDNSLISENLSLSIPHQFSNLLSLSTSTLSLNPGKSLNVILLFNAPSSVSQGTYLIPLNISTIFKGRKLLQKTELLVFTISNTTNTPSVYDQITLINSTTLSGVIKITNPTNSTFNNTKLQTYLPLNSLTSTSNITTSGIISNLTENNGAYTINWYLGLLAPKQIDYAYYTIQNVQNSYELNNVEQLLSLPSIISNHSILNITNIAISSFYTNSTNTVSVSGLYTGTSSQKLTFLLTVSSGIILQNSTRIITANPNDFISQIFSIKTGTTPGTFILTLYISTTDANLVYHLPIVVSQSKQTNTTKSKSYGTSAGLNKAAYAIIFLGLLLLIIILTILRRPKSKESFYDPERASKLIRIRNTLESNK